MTEVGTWRARGWIVLLGLGLFCFACLSASQRGFAWDEPAYLESAYLHRAWFAGDLRQPGSRVSKANLRAHWGGDFVRDSHPPAVKVLAAPLLASKSFGPLWRARLVAAAFFALGGVFLALCAGSLWGPRAGVFAALAWAGMPRVVGHAGILMLDLPVSVLCFAITWLMLRRLDDPTPRGMLLPGLVLGLGLLTKLNAAFAPLPALLVLLARRRLRHACVQALVYPVGAAVLFVCWPRLWRDPLFGFLGYAGFHVEHFDVPVFYQGVSQASAPWHYPFVLLVVTTPTVILVLSLVGALRRRSWGSSFTLGAALAVMIPLVLIALPMTPAYDGVRLFMPALPWVALAAARGADLVCRRAGVRARVVSAVLAVGLLMPSVLAFRWAPDYYAPHIGGAPGARALGFESTYLGYAVGSEVCEFLRNTAAPNANVVITPYSPKVALHLRMNGFLRPDITLDATKPPKPGDLVVIHFRRAEFKERERGWLALEPLFELTNDGVPLVRVVRLPD